MIIYKSGSLLDVTSGIIAHGCNAQGVMGAGVAKLIKHKYPLAHQYYLSMPKTLGSVEYIQVTETLWVANCIIQEFYGRDKDKVYVSYDAIFTCFNKLNKVDVQLNIPLMGAGLAGGEWDIISDVINAAIPSKEVICWKL